MGKQPAFQFYPADWLQDTAPLSLEAKGAWIDLLCAMWRASPRGQLTHTLAEFSRLIRTTEERAEAIILEIARLEVADLRSCARGVLGDVLAAPTVMPRNEKVTLINRRMSRESDALMKGAKRQQKYRFSLRDKPCDEAVTVVSDAKGDAEVTVPSSASSTASKKQTPLPPQGGRDPVCFPTGLNSDRFKAAWEEYTVYRRERHLPVLKPISVKKQLERLALWGADRAIAAINHTIANGWQGIVEPRDLPPIPVNGHRRGPPGNGIIPTRPAASEPEGPTGTLSELTGLSEEEIYAGLRKTYDENGQFRTPPKGRPRPG